MTALIVLLIITCAWLALGILATIAVIGKPRKPVTPTVALVGLVLNGGIITLLIFTIIALASVHHG